MARPKKDNADYFSHDKNMRNDPKIKALRRKFKDGYGVYCMLLEVLTEADFFIKEISPIDIELIAGDFDIDSDLLTEIIEYCVKIQLLIKEENMIYSSGLRKRLQPVLDNRNAVKQRFLDKKLKEGEVSSEQNTQSKVKESKVKESIKIVVEEVIPETPNFEEKNEKEVIPEIFIDEEEKEAAVQFLKRHSLFLLIQKNQKLKSEEVLKLFNTFYDTKLAFGELKAKTKDDVVKHFFYWIQKQNQTQQKTPDDGTSNNFTRRNRTVTATADQKRADLQNLVSSMRGVLLGSELK